MHNNRFTLFFTRILIIILCVSIFYNFLMDTTVYASEVYKAKDVEIPVIKVTKINNKTGVKIKINKTKNAEGFRIYMSSTGTIYDKYLCPCEQLVAIINKDGSKARTYKINGLPKGKYTFRVCAMKKVTISIPSSVGSQNGGTVLMHAASSKPKTVKISGVEVETPEKTHDFSKNKKGDTISFGFYEQDGLIENGPEEIEWIVLSKNKKEMIIMSKYALECLPYNNEEGAITWADCSLRKWLNGYFYEGAFNLTEKNMIIEQTFTESHRNELYNTEEITTKDKVFLLSTEDIKNKDFGFDDSGSTYDIARRCAPTPYAESLGLMTSKIYEDYKKVFSKYLTKEKEYPCNWYIRLPKTYAQNKFHMVSSVDYYGSTGANTPNTIETAIESITVDGQNIKNNGKTVCQRGCGIRPVIVIKLN